MLQQENFRKRSLVVELSIVKLLLKHDEWLKFSKHIDASDFPESLQLVYRVLDTYHKSNTDKKDINEHDLANLFFSNKIADKEFYYALFDNLKSYDCQSDTVYQLIKSLKQTKLLRSLSLQSYEVAEGRKKFEDLQSLLQSIAELDNSSPEEVEDEFVNTSLQHIAAEMDANPGLLWRLPSLNSELGPLRKGTFIVVFARPETGKTSLLADQVSYFATQCGTDDKILWFNNEQEGGQVVLYNYRASLGLPLEVILSNPAKYEKEYKELTKDSIKVKDSASIHYRDVERLCKTHKPKLVVIDQIDKLKGFAADREDLVLGAIYIWAREIAKMYCPVIGVCQAGATGENKKWLTMDDMNNSKTSKAAECDAILGIGKIQDEAWDKVRFFHLSKNKLTGKHSKWEVRFNQFISRYEDI